MTETEAALYGKKIIITTIKIQNRKHRKSRINKKWARRYGYTVYDRQPEGQILVFEDKIYMTENDFNRISDALKQERSE